MAIIYALLTINYLMVFAFYYDYILKMTFTGQKSLSLKELIIVGIPFVMLICIIIVCIGILKNCYIELFKRR